MCSSVTMIISYREGCTYILCIELFEFDIEDVVAAYANCYISRGVQNYIIK